MVKVKESRKGSKTYSYWMASWREGGKTRNVHLGSARKMDAEAARRKASVMTAEDILDILPNPTAIHVRGHGFRSLNISREN